MPHTDFVANVLTGISSRIPSQADYLFAQTNEIIDSALARLKEVPPEAAVEFALAALRIIRQEQTTLLAHLLHRTVGQVLRRKLNITEDQAVEMIELVSMQRREFPFKGVLKAAESVPLTPRIANALRGLRPCLTEYVGGGEARDLHARIDLILSGPAPDSALEAQGAWSRIVFEEISKSPLRSAWERLFFHAADLKSSEASKKWRAASRQLAGELGGRVFIEAAKRWLALGPSPNTRHLVTLMC